jgi:hypothetical protein
MYKIKAGALQFTVFIGVIIALILAGLVMLFYTHRFFKQQSVIITDNIKLADSGINALLLQQNPTPDTLLLNVPESPDKQKVQIHLSQWGIFEKGYSRAYFNKKEFTKCALIGSSLTSIKRQALYLSETYKPLAVVGNTTITGDAALPQQGVVSGSIAGHSFYGGRYVDGNIKKSTDSLPGLLYNYPEIVSHYLNAYIPQKETDYIDIRSRKSTNSFLNNVKGYFSAEPIFLSNIILQGNIVIRSSSKITITRSAVLKDVIIAAPEVIIEDDVKGTFQVFADKKIKVGKDCSFDYPSAFILLKDENTDPQPVDEFSDKVYLGENCSFKGTIAYFGTNDTNYYLTNIYIHPSASVKGEIYCQGNLELRGKVNGSVFTHQFVTNDRGSIFVNHLYDTQISTQNFPEQFAGLLFKNEKKSICKWLH